MKKNKILSVLSSLAILLTLLLPVSVSGEEAMPSVYQPGLAEQLMEAYSPASYGGLYYEEDGTLVINALPNTEENTRIFETIKNYCPVKETAYSYRSKDTRQRVKIKTVSHSYQSLLDAFFTLSDRMTELGIRSVAIEEKQNTVVVTVENQDAILQKHLASLTERNVVTIVYRAAEQNKESPKAETVFTKEVDVKPGTEAQTDTSGFSIGFACGYNGLIGYTVPAHAVSVGQTITYRGETLGTVRYRSLGKNLDVAFVEKQDKAGFLGIGKIIYKGSNTTPENEYIGPFKGTPVSGKRVHFRGMKSGKTVGSILNANYSEKIGEIQLTDVVKADYAAIHGDSGGCVYFYDESPYEPRQMSEVMGTQSASYLVNKKWVSGTSYSIFIKAKNMTQLSILRF